MNRRDLIAGVAGLAAVAVQPVVAEDGEKYYTAYDQKSSEDNRSSLSTTAVIDDPDVEQIKITAFLKKGVNVSGSDSFILERALLKHVGTNMISWFKYCRDYGMKTL